MRNALRELEKRSEQIDFSRARISKPAAEIVKDLGGKYRPAEAADRKSPSFGVLRRFGDRTQGKGPARRHTARRIEGTRAGKILEVANGNPDQAAENRGVLEP